MKKLFYALILILVCIASFYFLRNHEGRLDNFKDIFTIYYVHGLDLQDALNGDIDTLPLEIEPALTEKDIEHYIWKHHIIELDKDGEAYKKLGDSNITDYKHVKPFVLVCNDERIYVGAFLSPVSSYLPECPSISIGLGQSSLHIRQLNRDDVRGDIRIYMALKSVGKIQ